MGVLTCLLSSALVVTARAAGTVDSSTQAPAPALQAVYKQLEELVHQYYPKAKLTTTGNAMHFEYKLKSEIGYYSGRTVMVPQDGGILAELNEKSGEYTGDDKNRLPSELPDGFHTTLKMAPYSKSEKSYLLALLTFPSDASEEFKLKFKDIVNSFAPTEQAGASASTAATVSATFQSAPQSVANTVAPTIISTVAPMVTNAAPPATKTFVPPVPSTNIVMPTRSSYAAEDSGMHLFTDKGGPIGGANTPDPVSSKSSTAGSGGPASDLVELKPFRYLPGYPTKVRILASSGDSRHAVIAFYTNDPIKKVYEIWTKRLEKAAWNYSKDQPENEIHAYVNLHPDQGFGNGFGGGGGFNSYGGVEQSNIRVVIKYAPVHSGGTVVRIEYSE